MSHEHHPIGWALVHLDWGQRQDDGARRLHGADELVTGVNASASVDARPALARRLVARLGQLLRCGAADFPVSR